MRAPVPDDEQERLRALDEYDILDSLPESAFDDLVALASHICETPIALVSLVAEDRQWFKACKGIEAREMPRDVAFCAHAILEDGPMIVNDTFDDQRFADNPLVLGEPHIRFYAGAPLLTPDGHKLGTLCAIDSRPRKLSEEQIRLLEALARQVMDQLELRRSMADLRRTNHAKDRLFTLISHDLRSPMQAMIGFSDLIDQRLESLSREKIRDYNNRVLVSARRSHRILESLLDLARFELGEMSYRPRPIVIDALLSESIANLAGETEAKGLDIVFRSPPTLIVLTDPQILRPVVRNLLWNAVKFSREEGRMGIEVERHDEHVEIVFWDEGIGMSAEVLEQYRAGKTRRSTPGTAGEEGIGLGLMLIRQLVHRLGGRLAAESELGRGSRITLSLPLERA